MPSSSISFLVVSIIALVVGLRMKSATFDPNDPFSGPRAAAKPGLIVGGIFGILLFIAEVIVGFQKGKIGFPFK